MIPILYDTWLYYDIVISQFRIIFKTGKHNN